MKSGHIRQSVIVKAFVKVRPLVCETTKRLAWFNAVHEVGLSFINDASNREKFYRKLGCTPDEINDGLRDAG